MRKLTRISALILAAATMASAAVVFVIVVYRAFFPYELDYEEGNILNTGVRLAHGLAAYPDPHSWPSVINPYPPVIYLFMKFSVQLFGLTFVPGRMLVIGAGLITAVLIAMILRRETKSWAVGVAFAGVFLCSPIVSGWMGLLRVDMPATVLAVAGIYLFSRKRITWAALLFVAAVFTKHTALAAPAACFCWSLLERDRASALKLLKWCVAVGGALYAICLIVTRGSIFFYLFRTHPDAFRWEWYWFWMSMQVTLYPLASMLVVVAFGRDIWKRRASLWVLYLLFCIIGAVTLGKFGSNTNHLIEFTAALCIVAGLGWHTLSELGGSKSLIAAAIALMLCYTNYQSVAEQVWPERKVGCDALAAQLHSLRGNTVLSENMGAVVQAGKNLPVSNPFVYTQLVKNAGWSDEPLVRQLQSKQIDLIIMDNAKRQAWSKRVMGAIHANYDLRKGCDCPFSEMFFVPKG